jgi:hypothetical protein
LSGDNAKLVAVVVDDEDFPDADPVVDAEFSEANRRASLWV